MVTLRGDGNEYQLAAHRPITSKVGVEGTGGIGLGAKEIDLLCFRPLTGRGGTGGNGELGGGSGLLGIRRKPCRTDLLR